jgi:hypothetical protein
MIIIIITIIIQLRQADFLLALQARGNHKSQWLEPTILGGTRTHQRQIEGGAGASLVCLARALASRRIIVLGWRFCNSHTYR